MQDARWHLIQSVVAKGSTPWPDVDQVATDVEHALYDGRAVEGDLLIDLVTAAVLGEDARGQLAAWAEAFNAP